MFSKVKLVAVVLLLALVLQLVGFSAVQARTVDNRPEAAGGVVSAKVISPAQQKAALAFWTRDQIAKAQPLEIQVDRGAASVDESAVSRADAFAGQFSSVSAGAAAPDANQKAQAAYPRDWAMARAADESAAADEPTGTSATYTSYTVNQWVPAQTVYPHKWIGRLSFKTSGGTSYCSGTAVSGNVMVTAAHCIYDSTNNVWYNSWVFTPAYRNGSAPYGSFAASTCWVLTAWVNLTGGYSINTWTRYDVGVCKMGNNSAGQTLNSAVGYMGRSWNYGYFRHFHDLGYPFKDYNNVYITNAGLFLRTCAAESFQQTTDTLGMGCNWGGGISGGPWMTGYAPNVVSGQVNSVNSGLYIGAQNLYGIRFTSSNIVPLCTAAGC
jgi:V8-like Glu-specific endopeptidase